MRTRHVWIAVVVAVIAQTVLADGVVQRRDLAESARLTPDPRLRLFAFGRYLDTGAMPAPMTAQMKRDMAQQGFYYTPGASPLIALEGSVAPTFGFDQNINGGVYNGRLEIGGAIFETTPKFLAKAGLVTGAAVDAEARVAWSEGRYLSVSVQGEIAYAPEFDLGTSTASVQACSANHLAGWTFLDVCQREAVFNRALARTSAQETSASLTQLFATANGVHAVEIGARHRRYDSYDQDALEVSANSVWSGVGTQFSASFGAPVPDETAQRLRLSGEVRWWFEGRPMGLGVWYQSADGGQFLGLDRVDHTTGLTFFYDIRPRLTVQVDYLTNRSSIDFFKYHQIGFGATYRALEW